MHPSGPHGLPVIGRPRDDSWRVEQICKGCGVAYQPKHKGQMYHSHACYLGSLANTDALRARASSAGVKGGAVTGAQKRAAGIASGVWYAKAAGTGVHEHRLVAETVLGRALLDGEIVHHEDRNKRHNDRNNLIVFPSQADHARHHKLNHCLTPCSCPGIRLGR